MCFLILHGFLGIPVNHAERPARAEQNKSQEDEYQADSDKPHQSEVNAIRAINNFAATGQMENNEDVRTIFVNRPSMEIESASELEFANIEDTLTRRRVIIVLMALMVRYLLFLCEQYAIYFFQTDILNLHLNKIFLPFLLYEIIEFLYYPTPVQRSSLLMAILSFKTNPRFSQKLLIGIGVVNKFSKDLMLYFFTFCVFEFIMNFVTIER